MTKIDLVGSLIELREEYIYLYKHNLGLFNSPYQTYEEYIPNFQRLYDVNQLTNELGGKLFDTMIGDGTFFNHVYLYSEKENSGTTMLHTLSSDKLNFSFNHDGRLIGVLKNNINYKLEIDLDNV